MKTIMVLVLICPTTWSQDISGFVRTDLRLDLQNPLYQDQSRHNLSSSTQFELSQDWDTQQLKAKLFLRLDPSDQSHIDARELYWKKLRNDWELKIGFDQIFWGVTESVHLIDIINQTDTLERDLDSEDKLGQPMVSLTLNKNWGKVEAFYLPYFRERSFPDRSGRLRLEQPILDPDFESSLENWQPDLALRYSHSLGNWDFGLYHFWGTNREPILQPELDAWRIKLRPTYHVINQTGLNLLWTKNSLQIKLEALHQNGGPKPYSALVAGLEYTLYGVFSSKTDVGFLAEYMYDDRGIKATNPFQNDVFFGLRITPNDTASTQILGGIILDTNNSSKFIRLEFSRRLKNNWTLDVQGNWLINIDKTDVLFPIRQDDYIQASLTWHF